MRVPNCNNIGIVGYDNITKSVCVMFWKLWIPSYPKLRIRKFRRHTRVLLRKQNCLGSRKHVSRKVECYF